MLETFHLLNCQKHRVSSQMDMPSNGTKVSQGVSEQFFVTIKKHSELGGKLWQEEVWQTQSHN